MTPLSSLRPSASNNVEEKRYLGDCLLGLLNKIVLILKVLMTLVGNEGKKIPQKVFVIHDIIGKQVGVIDHCKRIHTIERLENLVV